jgi:uroporphyrinogen-III synthase
VTRRVLVTRPEPGASATANALRVAGFEPVVASLTQIVPLPVDAAFDIGGIDAIAVTSANALRHAPEQLLARIAGLPLFAVGQATAEVADEAGFRAVITGPGDAAGLTAIVRDTLPAGSTILYLCGRLRRPDFERAMEVAGLKAAVLETYDTGQRDCDAAILPILAATSPLFAVLLHSSEGAKALSALMSRPDVAHPLTDALLVAISARAAMPVEAMFPGRILVASQPTEAAMIATLRAST